MSPRQPTKDDLKAMIDNADVAVVAVAQKSSFKAEDLSLNSLTWADPDDMEEIDAVTLLSMSAVLDVEKANLQERALLAGEDG